MPPAATQLYVELAGAGAGTPLVLNSPSFNTTPTSGGYYIEAINTVVGASGLYIQLNGPNPSSDGGFTKTVGTTIIWGP